MAPGPSGLAVCLASETGLAPGGAPWRRRSNPVLRSRISPKPSWIAFHAASGERDRATTWDSSSDIATQYLARVLLNYFDSPAASRAPAFVEYSRNLAILPPLTATTQ